MTITEDLQFSILTAPIATMDRRTLSQAWYSALYGAREAKPAQAQPSSKPAKPSNAASPHGNLTESAQKFTCVSRATCSVQAKAPGAKGADLERRAPRSQLARKIERAFLHPRKPLRKASFTIEGAHGRVQVLLRTHGSQVKLVALCPPKARDQVAAALGQARYALALRGIELDAQTRDEAPC